ncbi:DUF7255 family protein [Arthrobacter sp. PGP41]|uniref:DUF7255 family protein n=1 Tax=Arthrobacter sp. PGP41 TaxID=2079227 RepID=UPI001319CED5|nr:hypothetical protein [Arthrobacter sp. PGP41]
MAREEQSRILDLVANSTGGDIRREYCPAWLMRPGKTECGRAWPQVSDIYHALTGLQMPEVMPLSERRSLDGVVTHRNGEHRIIEYDEEQHFNHYRALTLAHYPEWAVTAYDRNLWADHCRANEILPGGRFGSAKPPLFPMAGGRHRQRAFRDMLADLLPPLYDIQPTLRIASFEVRPWLYEPDAEHKMLQLVEHKIKMSDTKSKYEK